MSCFFRDLICWVYFIRNIFVFSVSGFCVGGWRVFIFVFGRCVRFGICIVIFVYIKVIWIGIIFGVGIVWGFGYIWFFFIVVVIVID